ncbi:hypothetical protein ACLKA6_008223 [Drosophila palustris]
MAPKRAKKAAPKRSPPKSDEPSDLDPNHPLNVQGAPRRGAFELSFAPHPTTVTSEQRPIWSGLKRTPRAQKFPNVDEMSELIIQAYTEMSGKNNKRKRASETSPSPASSTSTKRIKKEK